MLPPCYEKIWSEAYVCKKKSGALSVKEDLRGAQESDMEPAAEKFSENEQDIVEIRQTSADVVVVVVV